MNKRYLQPRNKKEATMQFSQLIQSVHDNEKFVAAIQDTTVEVRKSFDPENNPKASIAESANQHSIITYLEYLMTQGKLFFARTNNGGVYDEKAGVYRALARGAIKGFPDILVMMNGRAIFLEVKSKAGKQSPEQAKVQQMLEAQGAEYYIVRTVEYTQKALG